MNGRRHNGEKAYGGKVRCIPPPAPPASLRQELKSGDVPKRHAAQKVGGKFFCDKFGEKIRDRKGDKNKVCFEGGMIRHERTDVRF